MCSWTTFNEHIDCSRISQDFPEDPTGAGGLSEDHGTCRVFVRSISPRLLPGSRGDSADAFTTPPQPRTRVLIESSRLRDLILGNARKSMQNVSFHQK